MDVSVTDRREGRYSEIVRGEVQLPFIGVQEALLFDPISLNRVIVKARLKDPNASDDMAQQKESKYGQN